MTASKDAMAFAEVASWIVFINLDSSWGRKEKDSAEEKRMIKKAII